MIPNPDACGEDSPIYDERLKRDGWHLRQEMQIHKIRYGYATDRPEIWSRRHPTLKVNLLMMNSMDKFAVISNYSLEHRESRKQQAVDGAVWADWDHRGRLVFAKEGALFAADVREFGNFLPIQLADFNEDKPVQIPPPDWATKW